MTASGSQEKSKGLAMPTTLHFEVSFPHPIDEDDLLVTTCDRYEDAVAIAALAEQAGCATADVRVHHVMRSSVAVDVSMTRPEPDGEGGYRPVVSS